MNNDAKAVYVPGVFKLPRYEWWDEALHGVASSPGVHFGGKIPCATSFPSGCTIGAAWNMSLWEQIGDTVGKEGRAMHNDNRAGLTFWTPVVQQGKFVLCVCACGTHSQSQPRDTHAHSSRSTVGSDRGAAIVRVPIHDLRLRDRIRASHAVQQA